MDQVPQDHEVPRPTSELAATVGVPGPPLISADAAAAVLRDFFLANADRGDNSANDQLVAELVPRIRAQRASHGGSC
ncbi:MAG: hypothetical protein ACT4NP_05695 [Pseudonocardiales bacterium]